MELAKHGPNRRAVSLRTWLTTVARAAALLPLLPTPLSSQPIDCFGNDLEYTQTGDGTDEFGICGGFRGWGRCQQPVLGSPVYEMDTPGCNPYFGSCSMTAMFTAEFPGNHQNDPTDVGLFYSYATVELYTLGGTLVGACGVSGQVILQDFGEVTVAADADCFNPAPGRRQVLAIMCKDADPSSCEKVEELFLDFNLTAGCIDIPMHNCGSGDASCEECTPGGIGAGGGPPGVGGPGSPPTGPKATLRYTAGGAGRAGLPGSAAWNVALGRYWSHDYAEAIVPVPDESRVWLVTKHATFREWSSPDAGGVYQSVKPSSEYRTLTWLGAGVGWELRDLDGTVTLFDASGRWLSATDRNGNAKTATYGGSGELLSVAFPDGRREDFLYYPAADPSEGKLQSITEVGVDNLTTSTWEYVWNGDDLVRIDRPDGTALLFAYGDARHPGYLTRMELEGTDDTSVRVLRGYEYDDEGNVTGTWKGDVSPAGPDAVEVWAAAYDDPAAPTVTTVTPPVGDPIVYQVGRDTESNRPKVLSISGDCPTCGLGPNSQLFYEDASHPLLPTRIVDGRGTATALSYDAFDQVVSRTEAMSEAEERTTSFTYDPTYPALLTSIEQPSVAGGASLRTTDWLRDASGNATDRTISGAEAGSAFTHTTTTGYNAAGQPLTIDPPGHGTADETSFTYDPARGDLVADTRTDPLVGTTTFGYDAFNRRTSVTDPNGVETKTSYDELDRVTEVRQVGASPPTDDLVTTHTYTVFRDLFQTELPAGNVVEYGYDPAGRLISVEQKPDAVTHGERVFYTLDEAGNRTLEELQRWDAGASAWVTFSSTEFVFTSRCQVDRIVQAPGSAEQAVTELSYDCNGNLLEQWDPNHDAATDPPSTSYSYDVLDRLTSVSQPWTGGALATTSYSYDVQDHLTSVTDAEGNTTTYTYSDRDLLTAEISTVSGTTTHNYDEHGELVETTDARGVTVTRSVDALDRVTFADYPDDALDTTYAYDAAPAVCAGASFPVGRLAAITRGGEAVEYCYDRFGRTTRDGELTYAWDANGNRTGIGYPGGVVAAYTHDFADREVTLSVTTPAGAEPVVQAASYLPSGPLSTLLLGSGATETRGFDGRYAPTSIALNGPVEKTFTYTTDKVGNILEIVEQAGCTPGPLVLESQLVTTEELFVSCTTIEAGNGFAVESPGDVTFHADGTIALTSGFSVGDGARFAAGSGELPELSRRSYGYQAPQYFLTAADGPWGTLDWSYDKIGNRLTESRDEGATADAYVYLTNGSGGNTPVLDVVNLAVGGTRDYTYGLAGHLEEVAAGANVVDFTFGDASRLAGADRTASGGGAVSFLYDGRSFLRTTQETSGETSSVDPLYDSAGLLHALRRQASPTDPVYTTYGFYLAGRPVAQLTIDGAGTETWTYFTTDHLGTPLLATDDVGAVAWEGGFLPFGGDYQQGTPKGALENGIHLRYGNEWEDSIWEDATSGTPLIVGFDRWQTTGTARYLRPLAEIYYLSGPIVTTAVLEPPAGLPDSLFAVAGEPLRPISSIFSPALLGASPFAKMVCDGCDGFKWVWVSNDRPVCAGKCFVMHEEDHIDWFHQNRPDACKGRDDGANPLVQPGDKAKTECRAYGVSFPCLENERRKAKALGKTQECQSFLSNNARRHKSERDEFCKQANP